MIDAVAGHPFVAMTDWNVPGLLGTLGVRIEDDLGNVIVSRRTGGILESPPESALYLYTFPAAPTLDGTYAVIWDDEADFLQEELVVHGAVTGLPDWAPTVEEIARVLPAYTRGGFDDDEYQGGAEQGTFTDTTKPTADEVVGLVGVACGEITGRVSNLIRPRDYPLARATAIWYVAAVVSSGKLPAQTDDAAGEYRGHIARYLDSLAELARQVRIPSALRLV